MRVHFLTTLCVLGFTVTSCDMLQTESDAEGQVEKASASVADARKGVEDKASGSAGELGGGLELSKILDSGLSAESLKGLISNLDVKQLTEIGGQLISSFKSQEATASAADNQGLMSKIQTVLDTITKKGGDTSALTKQLQG